MALKFPNLRKETDIQVQEAQRVPNKVNPNRPIPRQIILKMEKVKDKENSKGSKRKTVIYKGTPLRLSAYFSAEILQDRRE